MMSSPLLLHMYQVPPILSSYPSSRVKPILPPVRPILPPPVRPIIPPPVRPILPLPVRPILLPPVRPILPPSQTNPTPSHQSNQSYPLQSDQSYLTTTLSQAYPSYPSLPIQVYHSQSITNPICHPSEYK